MAQRGKSPPLETLLDAANLALFFSKARRIGQADIHYTQVKNLRRAKDRAPGSVIPMREKNLFVRLDQTRLDLLLGIDETRDY
jgi:predicted ribosome quality control (RQC) complex YloA/Tae2 family protein